MHADHDRLCRLAFAAGALSLLGFALLVRPLAYGDSLEYLLQTESLVRHASPEARAGDVLSLARQAGRLGLRLDFALGYRGYYDDGAGRWYAVHFWAWSLLAAPARLALAVFGLNGLHAFALTSTLLLLLALRRVLFGLPFRPGWRVLLALLLASSPVLSFLRWPHGEAPTVATVTLALAARYAGRPVAAVLWAALASLQSPPFTLLVALLWLDAILRGRSLHTLARVTPAAALALASPLFYLCRFGTPSLLARESASVANASLARAAGLFLDPNLGLVRAMPLAVLLFAGAASVAWVRVRDFPFEAALASVTFLMAFACGTTSNWNHGTIGPSRYAVWLVPCLLFPIARIGMVLTGRLRGVATAATVLAIASQAAILAARGGPLAPPDDHETSALAGLVLRHAPALYAPDPSVITARTLDQPAPRHPHATSTTE